MTTQDTAWQAGESAAGGLVLRGRGVRPRRTRPAGRATLAVLRRAARKPQATAAAACGTGQPALAGPVAAARWLGLDAAPPSPCAGDKRFADPSWSDNPAFFAVRQAHLATAKLVADLLAVGAGERSRTPRRRSCSASWSTRPPRRTSC